MYVHCSWIECMYVRNIYNYIELVRGFFQALQFKTYHHDIIEILLKLLFQHQFKNLE